MAISVLFALSLNLITGFCGQISLGHAAFLGVGAYTSAHAVQGGGAVPADAATGHAAGRSARHRRRPRQPARARGFSGHHHHGRGLPVRRRGAAAGVRWAARWAFPPFPTRACPRRRSCCSRWPWRWRPRCCPSYVRRCWMGRVFDAHRRRRGHRARAGHRRAALQADGLRAWAPRWPALAGGALRPAPEVHRAGQLRLRRIDHGAVDGGGRRHRFGDRASPSPPPSLSVLPSWFQVIGDYKLLVYGGLLFMMMRFSPGGMAALVTRILPHRPLAEEMQRPAVRWAQSPCASAASPPSATCPSTCSRASCSA